MENDPLEPLELESCMGVWKLLVGAWAKTANDHDSKLSMCGSAWRDIIAGEHESSAVLEQAKKLHAEGHLFGNGTFKCALSEEEVLAELVEDEEGEFDGAAAVMEEWKPLQGLAPPSHLAALRIVYGTGPPVRKKARSSVDLGCRSSSELDTLTQHFQMTMTTSSPSRVLRTNPCSLPVSGGSVLLFGPERNTAPFLLSSRDSLWSSGDLHLENTLEDQGVSGQLVLDKIALEFSVWQQCRPLQLVLTAHQLLRKREGFSVTLRRRKKPSSSLCSCWTSLDRLWPKTPRLFTRPGLFSKSPQLKLASWSQLINFEVVAHTTANWVHLLAARCSLKAEQLRQRTPPAVRSPLSLAAVPADIMASGALRVAAGFARDYSLALDITPSRLWCSAWFVSWTWDICGRCSMLCDEIQMTRERHVTSKKEQTNKGQARTHPC